MNLLNGKIEELELRRKILHILIGITALILLIYNILTPFVIFIILIIGIIISLVSIKIKLPVISFFLEKFDRKSSLESNLPGRGIIFAVVGSLLVLQLFPRDIALASIAILTFADSTSHLFGKVLGRTPSFLNSKKNIEGHIIGAFLSTAIAALFVPLSLAFAGSLTAMIFESIIIEIQKIQLDDNLIIPLVAGTTMFLISKFII